MQLGSFRSAIGNFLSQLGIGPVPPATPTPPPTFDGIAWMTGVPALVPRRASAIAQSPWLSVRPVLPPVPPAPPVPTEAYWAGVSPPVRRPSRISQHPAWTGPLRVADVTASVPALSWRGQYPDRIYRKVGPQTGKSEIVFTAALAGLDPSRFGWRGTGIDWTWRRALPVGGQQTLALLTPSVFPIPALSWRSTYPDWLRGKARPPEYPPFAWEPNSRPNAVAPDHSWVGYQPDRVDRTRASIDRGGETMILRVTPFAPTFVSGLVSAPAQVFRAIMPAGNQRTWAEPFLIVIPDRPDWYTRYADLVRRPRRMQPPASPWVAEGDRAISPVDWYTGGMQAAPRARWAPRPEGLLPPPGSLILVGPQMTWAMRPPLQSPPIRRPEGGLVEVIPPDVIAGGVGCVELTDGQVTSPALLAATLTSPALVDGVLTSPELSSGEVC